MDKQLEINRITQQFKATFEGSAWHGPNIMQCLTQVGTAEATNQLKGSKSIAELVLHMIAWREFAIKKLQGQKDFDITGQEANFPTLPRPFGSAEWAAIIKKLEQSQRDLLAELQAQEDSLLEKTVPLRQYSFYHLLHGVLQHDLYHLGQIRLLSKYT